MFDAKLNILYNWRKNEVHVHTGTCMILNSESLNRIFLANFRIFGHVQTLYVVRLTVAAAAATVVAFAFAFAFAVDVDVAHSSCKIFAEMIFFHFSK